MLFYARDFKALGQLDKSLQKKGTESELTDSWEECAGAVIEYLNKSAFGGLSC